jgi:hypothetical protein
MQRAYQSLCAESQRATPQEKNLVERKNNGTYLAPTGLLMEGHYAHDHAHAGSTFVLTPRRSNFFCRRGLRWHEIPSCLLSMTLSKQIAPLTVGFAENCIL